MLKVRLLAALVVLASGTASSASPPTSPVTILASDRSALDAAERDLCGRQVALLGEGPTHGDGHTEAFKVALVERLVDRCHYSAIAFESGRYEFIALNRALRSRTATTTMLSNAVGALWSYHREFQPLVSFLFARAEVGRIHLAGLDYQIGGLGESFTNEQMIPELTAGLASGQAGSCRAAFARHVQWAYPAEKPYGRAEQGELLACVAAMRTAALNDVTAETRTRDEKLAMIDNLRLAIEPDLQSFPDQLASRENALYGNFLAFRASLEPRAKIIVWGATTHLAKNASEAPGFGTFPSLGHRIHQVFGNRAFSLGFSALRGSYRYSRKLIPIAPPPPAALEQQALGATTISAVYLDRRRLNSFGVRPSAALDHVFHIADWPDILDGMVVLAEEWPAHSTRPGYE